MSAEMNTVLGAWICRTNGARLNLKLPKRPDIISSSNGHQINIFNATIKMFKDREEDSTERVSDGSISIEEFGWEMTETDSERNRFLGENQPIIVFSSREVSTSSK